MRADGSRAVRAAQAKVGLSTASVYPEGTAAAFEVAAKLGYDGVEVMVWTDPVSQDPHALLRLSQHYQVAILAVHAPCLMITQRVWTTDPWVKLQKAQFAAELLGAQTVVVHPPFRWQRDYARGFRKGIAQMANETDVRFAVENMFPLRVRGREVSAYQPTWDVAADGGDHRPPYRDYTLDLSHAAVSHSDAMAMLETMGERLSHLHVADGSGLTRDEHLIPGRGGQPCAQVLEALGARGYRGHVVVEVNTRRALDRAEREADLAEALAFCRLHLVAPAPAPRG
ncbi:MAG: sugar phosphate isomerase/epimerase [Jatrophihabitans sp.]|nr:MAG: sugar phosphate isomerase/epimerase [Jatrophihabitans sp.]